ncbi:MAG: hypothetical protein IT357_04100 [Gemmatimonadaceae bacterium]|nr:hypothetical protein [Gemmatimonadaceae bacterium]
MAETPDTPAGGIYALSYEERWKLAAALMNRPARREDGLAAIRAAFPTVPKEMAFTAAHHLYGDGPEAAVDFLAAAELMIREPSTELDGGATAHLTYHLYNWLQFRALLPDGKQDVLELVKELRQAVEENDMEFVKATLQELEDVVEGSRTPPDVTF